MAIADATGIYTKAAGLAFTVALGLGMFWLQNTWRTVEDSRSAWASALTEERIAREKWEQSIANTYVTNASNSVIFTARKTEIEAIVARIERNTDRIIANEVNDTDLRKDIADLKADIAELHASLAAIERNEVREGHSGTNLPK